MKNLIEKRIACKLQERKQEKSFRSLRLGNPGSIDFSSNDYLGFARNQLISQHINKTVKEGLLPNGSGGSRLITGNSAMAEDLEENLADFFKSASTLLFNSGYMANLAIFSALPGKGDTIIYDELAHACIKDGARLSMANRFSFRHNDIESLKQRLKKATGQVFIGVESIYSMDGDKAPLREIVAICKEAGAVLIVDEAHSTGIYGGGSGLVVELGLQEEVFARVHTFGKAIGCHGACIAGSTLLRDYLINFARTFIYTTALPHHTLVSIQEVFNYLKEGQGLIADLQERIEEFRQLKKQYLLPALEQDLQIESDSPIQAIVLPGVVRAKRVADLLQQQGYDVRPILSPTVPKGKERLRICLHAYNSKKEIEGLVKTLANAL